MESMPSSCEVPAPAPAASSGSRVLHFQEGFRWQDVPVVDYKQENQTWRGVCRQVLVGERGEHTAFELRYFEIGPSGYSTRESHVHEHVVYVLRGRGRVELGKSFHDIGPGDVVYVAPSEVHQFRNPSETEPLGFLCMVDRQRDVGVPAKGE
ncbi:MAG: cupin domain-containing protein [Gemmataceae bacterium]